MFLTRLTEVRHCLNYAGCPADSERPDPRGQGYRLFRCRDCCGKQFNERIGGRLKRTQFPSDVTALAVFSQVHYKLSLRDFLGIFLLRGIVFS